MYTLMHRSGIQSLQMHLPSSILIRPFLEIYVQVAYQNYLWSFIVIVIYLFVELNSLLYLIYKRFYLVLK